MGIMMQLIKRLHDMVLLFGAFEGDSSVVAELDARLILCRDCSG